MIHNSKKKREVDQKQWSCTSLSCHAIDRRCAVLHRENVARGDELRVFKLYRGGERCTRCILTFQKLRRARAHLRGKGPTCPQEMKPHIQYN